MNTADDAVRLQKIRICRLLLMKMDSLFSQTMSVLRDGPSGKCRSTRWASLEEVVVPIITLAKRPDNIELCFVNPVITLKPRVTPELVLYQLSAQQASTAH